MILHAHQVLTYPVLKLISAVTQMENRDLLIFSPLYLCRGVPARKLDFLAMELTMFVLHPLKRRILYVSVFEIIAIIASTLLLMVLSGGSAENSLPVAVVISLIAVTWNYTYNLMFEKWEAKRKATDRSLAVRISHAFGFEFGLCVIIIPIYMAWYAVGFWKAFQMEAVLLLFFLIYTFVFTYIFDLIFALPNSVAATEKAA